ncbi:MAG: right-handed parallel beta-helix repeat-containing protein, partial [Deltaproteobacteria bacterium]|nr:right-handed parallel beta-helix repeat-containing protein [Deltaproteobacteria bacterium]
KVRENRFHNNDRGIWLERIKNAEIDNNDVYQNQRGVLITYAYDLKIRQNLIHNNTRGQRQPDLNLSRIYDFEIYNNKFWDNWQHVYLAYGGVDQKDQSFFYGNIIEINRGGTRVSRRWYLRGLYVNRSAHTVFSSNIIRNSGGYGILLRDSTGPIDFRHNKVSNNTRAGLLVMGAFDGNIFKNLFVDNGLCGVRFAGDVTGNSLEIYDNTVADNAKAGMWFEGGLQSYDNCDLFHNIFAFNAEAGYRYGDETWPQKERWDWVDKHDNFFFWNHGSLAGGFYNQERTQFINAQWGGPGGSGTDDITMEQAHWDYDQDAWDFLNDPDDPYNLDPLDTSGALELADGYPGGAHSEYLGRSASYTTADPPDFMPPEASYLEPIAVDPPAVPAVPVVPSPFPE